MTTAANFATGTDGVVDTDGKFSTSDSNTSCKFAADVNDTGGKKWEQYQTAGNLKWTWITKFIYI